MKKKLELFKTIQLIIFIGITVFALILVFTDNELYQMIGSNSSVRRISILLWLSVGLSFLFILRDFNVYSSIKKDYKELDFAVYNDQVAGIANRYSCDAMVGKYMDKPLPDTLGCIMMDMSNIRDINEKYGHLVGNNTIQEFANILLTCSVGVCFVGRNGGNKFMALFESCEETKLNAFLTRVNQKVEQRNIRPDVPRIEYRTGRALATDETVQTITQLIALADKRLTSQNDAVTGFANRASCDDIISMYIDKALPENMACVMLEISNIREINARLGHLEGNNAIRHFGDALREASQGLCFVGRNGGTKFMALFEDCSSGKLDAFLTGVKTRVSEQNAQGKSISIEYRTGKAFATDEDVRSVTGMISLADRQLSAQTDSVTGLASRASCDDIINLYIDKELPKTMKCVMFNLTNIREINGKHGHAEGNNAIRRFGSALTAAADGKGFVGRNGGTKFMALFENLDADGLEQFLSGVKERMNETNMPGITEPEYFYGKAFATDEGIASITQMVAHADRKLTEQTDAITGFASRASCDEIINRYIDKPLPPDIGCVMLEISNIRDINERFSHQEGNNAIRHFSDALKDAARETCFVGRNGGTKFLALFENCSDEKIDLFLNSVREKINSHNQEGNDAQIEYRFGKAFSEGPEIDNINRLVALSDRRLRGEG